VKNVSDKVVRHSLPNYPCDRFYVRFWVKLTALERNHRFSIYFLFLAHQL